MPLIVDAAGQHIIPATGQDFVGPKRIMGTSTDNAWMHDASNVVVQESADSQVDLFTKLRALELKHKLSF